MKLGILLKQLLLVIALLWMFTSCSAIECFISPDNTWGMLIFGIIMLVFWGWVFIHGIGFLITILGFVLREILAFFLPFYTWED